MDIIVAMIERPAYKKQLSECVRRSPVTALLGPRQCGKTTLARMFGDDAKEATYFDLESENDFQRLQSPELILGRLAGLVVLDEAQIMPSLFKTLRVLADRPQNKARFIILGSASPQLVQNVSETLAGRIEFIELTGFGLEEIGAASWEKLWVRGGFPRSFLAGSDEDSSAWREGFIRTFLERDIPQLGISIPYTAMRRFWTMLAHVHGQTLNASELARSMGISDKTARSHLDILTGAFMIRQLQPWHENLRKRQVKAPKIYFRDSGLLHSLLSLPDFHCLSGHPRLGASWEGFALEQILRIVQPSEAYFWGTHNRAELDLFFLHKGKRFGVEFKFTEAPKITKSMQTALIDLGLDHLWVIYPGEHTYPLHDKITALPLQNVLQIGKPAKQK